MEIYVGLNHLRTLIISKCYVLVFTSNSVLWSLMYCTTINCNNFAPHGLAFVGCDVIWSDTLLKRQLPSPLTAISSLSRNANLVRNISLSNTSFDDKVS